MDQLPAPVVVISETEIEKLPLSTSDQRDNVVKELKQLCKDGEIYNSRGKRCYKCEIYGLVWDDDKKRCRIKDKDEIIILQKKDGRPNGYIIRPKNV